MLFSTLFITKNAKETGLVCPSRSRNPMNWLGTQEVSTAPAVVFKVSAPSFPFEYDRGEDTSNLKTHFDQIMIEK